MSDAFELLCDLYDLGKRFDVPLPRQAAAKEFWMGIGFRSSSNLFVTPLHEISEVLKVPEMHSVPGTVDWVKIANLRGQILAVTDLQGFLTDKALQHQNLARILVTHNEGGLCGVLVEQILGLVRFLDSNWKEESDLDKGEYMPFVDGMFSQQLVDWHVFSIKKIVNSEIFYKVASG